MSGHAPLEAPLEAPFEARQAVERALEQVQRAGADQADALLLHGDSVEVRVRNGEIDVVSQARERVLGIRALVGSSEGFRSAVSSTSDLSPSAVERMAEETAALARATAPDPAAGLPDAGFTEDLPDLGISDASDAGPTVEARIDVARRAEDAARGVDPRIANFEGTDVNSDTTRRVYGNSLGFLAEYESTSHGISCMPIAQENGSMQMSWWSSVTRRWCDLDDPTQVGRVAAERALSRLGARRVPTCEVPIVFEPATARSLLGHLVACVSGSSVYRGASFLADRLGEAVASKRVSVMDDGRRIGGLGSRPFDGEGLPTRRTPVIEDGRLASYLLDTYSARKLGMASTGNASRGAGSAPGAGPTNLWLEPGEGDLDAIIADTERGFLVTWLFGHGFNPVSGDFSRGAAGHWIEGGRLSHPVEEVTIAGNLLDMLRNVDAVGDDLLWQGSVASPSVRISSMTVAGE
jgi:PmbA protein